MNITQTFYDNLAAHYDKLFLNWQAATQEQAVLLDKLFQESGFDRTAAMWNGNSPKRPTFISRS